MGAHTKRNTSVGIMGEGCKLEHLQDRNKKQRTSTKTMGNRSASQKTQQYMKVDAGADEGWEKELSKIFKARLRETRRVRKQKDGVYDKEFVVKPSLVQKRT
jgi:hypothetical protein